MVADRSTVFPREGGGHRGGWGSGGKRFGARGNMTPLAGVSQYPRISAYGLKADIPDDLADVRVWLKADIQRASVNVRFRG